MRQGGSPRSMLAMFRRRGQSAQVPFGQVVSFDAELAELEDVDLQETPKGGSGGGNR